MQRPLIYTGELPRSADFLGLAQATMVALGYLAQAVLGTNTLVDGLACSATEPASMSLNIGTGSIFYLTTLEATAYGTLAADTTDSLLKYGINTAAAGTTLAFTAPTTAGDSVNCVIYAQFLEADTGSTVLPYYNSNVPTTSFNGPAGAGTSNNTVRAQTVALNTSVGTPAATGSQTTPTVPEGAAPLYIVTIPYGATTLTSANFSVHPSAPFIPTKLPYIRASYPALIGQVTKTYMSVTSPSASASVTAEQVVVGTALGGQAWCIDSFSEKINLATTGAGGMDTGTAPTSGYVALYAIYNPVSQAVSILATNATSAAAPTIYAGGNMPSGYTASALLAVLPTNGSKQFVELTLIGRRVLVAEVEVLSAAGPTSGTTAISISSAAPPNAITADVIVEIGAGAGFGGTNVNFYAGSANCGQVGYGSSTGSSAAFQCNGIFVSSQQIYYTFAASSGSPTISVYVYSYTF